MNLVKKIIRKIIGIFSSLMCITGIFLAFTTSPPILFIIESFIFGYIAFLLLKKPKKTVILTKNHGESHNSTISFMDSEDMHAKPDNEVLGLVQATHEETIAKRKTPDIIRLIQESYKIMYETDNPETLCIRYKFASSKAEELNYYYRQGWYTDTVKINQYAEMFSDENYFRMIFHCYQKYVNKANQELKTKKGVDKRIDKFWSIIQNNVDNEIYIRLRQQ